jgi:hypothetical protein
MEKAPLLVEYEPCAREFIIRDRANGQNIIPEKDANGDFRDVYGLRPAIRFPAWHDHFFGASHRRARRAPRSSSRPRDH